MAGLSKSRILLNLQYPRRLWLKLHRPELEHVDEGMGVRFSIGDQVGDIARLLHPGGMLTCLPNAASASSGKPQGRG